MSTPWIVPAVADLNDYSAGAKIDALRTAALAGGQSDPFPRVMADVVSTMRAQIGSCLRNKVSATANSVPPSLKTHACWLIIQGMQARLIGLSLTDDEKEMIKKAERFMEKIASCDFLVETPPDPVSPTPFQGGAAIEVNDPPERLATRTRLDGI